MQAQPNPAEPTQLSAHPDADLEHDCAILRETAELGVDLLRTLHRQVTEAATRPEPPSPEHRETSAAAAERLMRAIRRTIHLRQHLRQTALTAAATRTVARAQIIRRVENGIETDRSKYQPGRETEDYAENLRTELQERIERPEFDHEVRTRPVAEIVTEIRNDLGIGSPTAPRRDPETLQTLYETAATPTRPHKVGGAPAAHLPKTPTPNTNEPTRPSTLLEHLLKER